MRRLLIALAIALLPSIALAHGSLDGGHRGGWQGGYGGRGLSGYAYPVPYYPGYVPENLTYCDPNSGTYIDEDGARHLCP
jgi:hypothetical protein